MKGAIRGSRNLRTREWSGPGPEEFRDDLDFAFGIVLGPPRHGPDIRGTVVYGTKPPHGCADGAVTARFAEDMRILIADVMRPFVDQEALPKEVLEHFEARPYSFPPAAQSWPLHLFNLWHDARPFLEDGALLLAWGAAIREVLRRVKVWVQARQTEVDWEAIPIDQQDAIEIIPILSQPAIVALCYQDLVERYGVTGSVSMESHGRGVEGATGPRHPGAFDQYLVRIQSNGPAYFWVVKGDGSVLDHFLINEGEITVLPRPSFDSGEPDEFRVAQQPYRSNIGAKN